MMENKLLPNAPEAERAVLSCLLLDNSAMAVAVCELKKGDFYSPRHSLIFDSIKRIFDEGRALDWQILVDTLRGERKLEEAGGSEYLLELMQEMSHSGHLDEYIRIVREKSILRSICLEATWISNESKNGVSNVQDFVSQSCEKIWAIARQQDGSLPVSTGETASKILEDRADNFIPISTQMLDLDEKIAGFHQGDFIILAAPTSHGKSALALSISRRIASKGLGVLYFSHEMSAAQLAERVIAQETKIDLQRIMRREFTIEEREKIKTKLVELRDLPLIVQQKCGMTVSKIKADCLRWNNRHKLKLVVVDYLGLLHGSQGRYRSRYEEVSEISTSLKTLAIELQLPILALHQLNRSIMQRESREPQLSDLRDSGQLEQDGDVVLLLHRPDLFRPRDLLLKNTAVLDIAKNRSGPTGRLGLRFFPESVSFENRA